jgi:hypothetical protein
MKVIDEAISRWINKLFGGLIEPVTPESINVSAREGRAQLENLTIRPSWCERARPMLCRCSDHALRIVSAQLVLTLAAVRANGCDVRAAWRSWVCRSFSTLARSAAC